MSRHRGEKGWPEPKQRRERRGGGGIQLILYLAIIVMVIAVVNFQLLNPPTGAEECQDYRSPHLLPIMEDAMPTLPFVVYACGLDPEMHYNVETEDGRFVTSFTNNTVFSFSAVFDVEEFGEDRTIVLKLIEVESGEIKDSIFVMLNPIIQTNPATTVPPTTVPPTTTNGTLLISNKIYKPSLY